MAYDPVLWCRLIYEITSRGAVTCALMQNICFYWTDFQGWWALFFFLSLLYGIHVSVVHLYEAENRFEGSCQAGNPQSFLTDTAFWQRDSSSRSQILNYYKTVSYRSAKKKERNQDFCGYLVHWFSNPVETPWWEFGQRNCLVSFGYHVWKWPLC